MWEWSAFRLIFHYEIGVSELPLTQQSTYDELVRLGSALSSQRAIVVTDGAVFDVADVVSARVDDGDESHCSRCR